jgi:hypothetical protein
MVQGWEGAVIRHAIDRDLASDNLQDHSAAVYAGEPTTAELGSHLHERAFNQPVIL